MRRGGELGRTEPAQLRKSSSVYKVGLEEPNSSLANILSCPICKASVCQARMCPSCCKMFCFSCIRNWLITKKECPNCSKQIEQSTVVNCETLARQIQLANPKPRPNIVTSRIFVQSPSSVKDMGLPGFSTPISINSDLNNSNAVANCPEHLLKLEYYCDACKTSLCSDCAVLGNKHQGHKLCKTSHKIFNFKEKRGELKKKLSQYKKEVLFCKEEMIDNFDKVHRTHQEKIITFENFSKKLESSILKTINLEIESNLKSAAEQKQYIDFLNSEFLQLSNSIDNEPKPNLVRKSICYQSEIQKAMDKSFPSPVRIKSKIENEIVPRFGTKVFIFDNFLSLHQKGGVLHSEPLFWKGVEWRLKIFPAGISIDGVEDESKKGEEPNDIEKGTEKFLALYLLMCKGYNNSNIYKYEILLINQLDRSKAIGCTFENEFEEGAYWGLDKFANVNELIAENFVHPIEGYLEIVLNVKSPSFYHATKDQNEDINLKEKMLKEKQETVLSLKKQILNKKMQIQIKEPKLNSEN